MTTPTPPRAFEWLLERVVPSTPAGQAMMGDLHEEFVARSRTGPMRARVWYAREALGVAVRFASRARRNRRPVVAVRSPAPKTLEGLVETLSMNTRYAVRRLLKSPLFTLIAVLSLGLGIGANTAMFSLVNAVIIRDVPYEDPSRLVDLYEASEGYSHGTLSYPDYLDVVAASGGVFSEVGGAQFVAIQGDVEGGAGVEMLLGEAVTGNYFGLLGVDAAIGRTLSAEDHVASGAHPVVMLGHGYWVGRFGADPDVLGSEIRLSGRPYTIIGVAPEAYRGSLRGIEPSVFVPIMMVDDLQGFGGNTLEARGNQSFFGRARLRPDATLAEAETVLAREGARLRGEYPTYWAADKSFVLERTEDVIMNPMVDRVLLPAAGLLMAVVGMVLLIACANLASFLLARAADRRKEIAVRLALGARRGALVGQLLTETVLLSFVGGVVGLVLAGQGLRALVGADLPLPIPVTLDLSLDRTVLGFSLVVSTVAGLLFGLAPALQSTNPDVAPTLRDETAGGGRARGSWLRDTLVVGQVAVSVVLLVAAGLFLRSLDASRSIDPGFGNEPTGIVQLTVPADRYSDEQAMAYLTELTGRIEALAGVASVGLVGNLHMNQLSTQNVRIIVDGVEPPVGQEFHLVDYTEIDDGFLPTAGIDLTAGRAFDDRDRADSEPVALVNEEFRRRFLTGADALGRSIVVNDEPVRVIGVTADHKVRTLGEDPRPFVYLPISQSFSNSVTVLARTRGDDERLAIEMMAEARAIDSSIMITDTKTMKRHLAVMLLGRELGAIVVGAFAALALLLASIGVYGVVSFSVSRRVREVGIRLSLGADTAAVVRMLTFGGMRLVVLGGATGLLLAAALARLMSRLLYGVPTADPLTFLAVPLVLGGVALLASWIPARRVTRIDPVGALRSE